MQNLTIKDVARLAGVGVSTVSRVINDYPGVNEQTRKKILDIIKEHNYMPNNSARSLKIADSKNIGILVKGISNTFFLRMIEAIEKLIVSEGYSIVLQHVSGDENEIIKAVELVTEKKVCGIIFLGGSFLSNEHDVERIGVPFVFTTFTLANCDPALFSSVYIDDIQESFNATEYLLALGHRKIAFLAAEVHNHSVAELRMEGYKRALSEHGIWFDEDLVIYSESFHIEDGYDIITKRLEEEMDFTAVYAISDTLAIGACKGILDFGFKIPEDISVIGFDGLDISRYYNPTITTMKQPAVEMAQRSVTQLFDLINGGSNKQEVFEACMVEGASCAGVHSRKRQITHMMLH